ncbi:MAG: 3-deoxy-D-manno-octulosonic acid transferase [Bacteroidales bacterium]|nr:3-deoxy-D-manno-octulosonic acid transferase [Bacteroidales bacterium]
MYSIGISIYAFAVRLVSPFNRKAQLMIRGQKETFQTLRNKIDPQGRYIWFHAASLGEFEQGRPLIEKIRKEKPQYKILLTFFSPSGYEVRKTYAGADVICYLPFDLKDNVNRFLDIVNPEMAIFIKYEFWMNYLKELRKRHITTYIVSAIFRPSQLFFRWYGKPYREILHDYKHLFVQDENSRQLLADYGVTNVTISGDTRFDRVYEIFEQRKELPLIDEFLSKTTKGKDFILVAGSTWPKDEDIIIPYFNEHPELKLIIAPHEIDENHLNEIRSKLTRPSLLYSEANEENIRDTDCLIINCFGLLSSMYRYGDIAYIGGGFGVGIHNVLEAAVYGIPVLFGPNFARFKEAQDLIDSQGGISIASQDEFNGKLNEYLAYPALLKDNGDKAGNFVKEYRGATDKIYDFINKEMEK